MKHVKISILDPALRPFIPDDSVITVDDDADFVDVLARIDESYMKRPIKAKRGNSVIRSILQLTWNARTNEIFEDIGIEARDSMQNWLPLRGNPLSNVPDNSTILITPDPGC
nr:hypothetical protein [Candidatus Sigynarchaeota archaeon]